MNPYASAMLVLASDHSSGEIRSWSGPSRRRMNAAETRCGPARDRDRLAVQIHAVRIGCAHPAIDIEQRRARAIDRDLDLLRRIRGV